MLACLDICQYQYIGSQHNTFWNLPSVLCENVKESGEIERVSFIFHHHREPPISTWIVVVEAAIVHFLQVEELLELVSEKERDHLWFASMGEERETLFKVFSCKENKRGIEKAKCPFKFQVRWDKHGYFVHLLTSLNWHQACGCPWHCCM